MRGGILFCLLVVGCAPQGYHYGTGSFTLTKNDCLIERPSPSVFVPYDPEKHTIDVQHNELDRQNAEIAVCQQKLAIVGNPYVTGLQTSVRCSRALWWSRN